MQTTTVTALQKPKVIVMITMRRFILALKRFVTMASIRTVMVLTVQQNHHHPETIVLVVKFKTILNRILMAHLFLKIGGPIGDVAEEQVVH